jgi:hypothetical protein
MKSILLASITFFVIGVAAAYAYKPAEERPLSEIAASGCSNRDGEFIIRGLVSNATEDTLVLSDTADERTTVAIKLPGRGIFARAKGVFSKNKFETAEEVLNQLRDDGTAVVATVKCHGKGTPSALNISYVLPSGERESITF